MRRLTAALPEVEEGTHFQLVSFKVAGTGFLTIEKGEETVVASVDADTAARLVDAYPSAYEVVTRRHGQRTIHVGVRVRLAEVDEDGLTDVVHASWAHRAPSRLHDRPLP